jgi:hypothetical protein
MRPACMHETPEPLQVVRKLTGCKETLEGSGQRVKAVEQKCEDGEVLLHLLLSLLVPEHVRLQTCYFAFLHDLRAGQRNVLQSSTILNRDGKMNPDVEGPI